MRRDRTIVLAIRPALAADLSAITGLLAASDLRTEGILADNTRYWIASDGMERPIGAIGVELGQTCALLRSAVVTPAHRGQKIGAQLTEHALDWAWQNGLRAVYCFSTDAGDYWMRRGFAQCAVDEVVLALPEAPQVRLFESLGWLRSEIAYVRFASLSSACLPS